MPALARVHWARDMAKSHKIGKLTVRPHLRGGQPTGAWQVDVPAAFSAEAKRQRLSFGSRAEADVAARALLRQLRQEGSILDDRIARTYRTVGNLIECWAEEQDLRVRSGKKRASSLRTNLFQLAPLIDEIGHLGVASLRSRDLEAFQAARIEAGVRPVTVNSETATFVQVMRWAVENGEMPRVLKVDRLPVARPKDTTLTLGEARQLLLHIDARWRPLLRFLMETGCRFGEASHLTWAQVNIAAQTANIEQRDDWRPKTEVSVRTLHLSSHLCAELASTWAPEKRFVFEGRKPGKPVDDLRRPLEKAALAAGLIRNGKSMRVRPKDIRSSVATWHSVNGVRERVLQETLGHAPGSRVTKRHYEQSTDPERLRASEQLAAMLSAETTA